MSVNVKAEGGQVKILRLCVTFLTLPLFNVKITHVKLRDSGNTPWHNIVSNLLIIMQHAA